MDYLANLLTVFQCKVATFDFISAKNIENNLCLLTLNHRCEVEERNTRRLEQQVDVLRRSKKTAEQRSVSLQEDIRHSMMELQEMHQDFQVTQMCH